MRAAPEAAAADAHVVAHGEAERARGGGAGDELDPVPGGGQQMADDVRFLRSRRHLLDRHQDHRAVHEASVIACRSVEQLLGYETPSSYPNFTPTVFQAIGERLELKVQALHSHRSQGARVYMQEEQIRSAANFRGTQVGIGPAEGFIPYKFIM